MLSCCGLRMSTGEQHGEHLLFCTIAKKGYGLMQRLLASFSNPRRFAQNYCPLQTLRAQLFSYALGTSPLSFVPNARMC